MNELSPYGINLFEDCPRQYRLQFHDKLISTNLLRVPFYRMAESLHKAIERFFALSGREPRTLPELFKHLREVWDSDAFANYEEDNAFFSRAMSILNKLPELIDLTLKPDQIGVILKTPMGAMVLMDKLTMIKNGVAYRLIVSPCAITDENYQFTAGLLAVLLQNNGISVSQIVLIDVVNGERNEYASDNRIIESAFERARQTGEQIAKETYFPAHRSERCLSCDYRMICPAWIIDSESNNGLDSILIYETMVKNLFVINAAAQKLHAILNRRQLFKKYLELILQIIDAEIGAIFILNDESGIFTVNETVAISPDIAKLLNFKIGDGLLGTLVKDGVPVIREEVEDSGIPVAINSLMCVPLEVNKKIIGAVAILNKKGAIRFNYSDLMLVAILSQHIATAVQNIHIQGELSRQELLQQQIETARFIQKSFLPEHPPDVLGYEFAAFDFPALGVGGDFYDFITLPDGRIAALIADVSGKGVPAAMYMAKFITDMRVQFHLFNDPVQVMQTVNSMARQKSHKGSFITALLLILDVKTHQVTVINAGHLPPILLREKTEELIMLRQAYGIPLGIEHESSFTTHTLTMAPGDCLYLYTDGALDAKNEDEKVFGIDRFMNILRQTRGTAAERREKIFQHLIGFIGERVLIDDITMVVFRRI